MPTLALTWDAWGNVINSLRARGLLYMAEHAAKIMRQLGQHPADQAMVPLSLTDDPLLLAQWES